ncbi:hypothetical protein BDQ12DRAFT_736595 [Crucibulum laeve]|uniref:Adipose-regulatory protein-domain-containing protein n=1 Tax=Crucibulum laeve TaxID=68775 RepID=A0A5C3LWU8_9AGAR|nr:hypothetical protein BDQ12DRAFT_736595 [Crucibulum laeve]
MSKQTDATRSAKDSRGRLSRIISYIVNAPFRIVQAVLSNGISTLRPYAPQIIPLAVCVLFIPLVISFSLLAGWSVWKSLSVGWDSPLYFQYGDGVSPYATAQIPPLLPQQRYNIALQLTIPASESNLALGNFMVGLALSTTNNKTLTYVRRPAVVVPPQSSLFFRTPYLIHVEVPLVDSFIAGRSKVVASIDVGRRDRWKTLGVGHERELTIKSASLYGIAVPHGVRGLAIRFPVTFGLISASTFLVILSIILGGCILPTMLRPMSQQNANNGLDEDGFKKESLRESGVLTEGHGERRRRRRSKSNRRSSSVTAVKVEHSESAIPPATSPSPSTRLRRRESKRLDSGSDSDT